jgi:hypothetical protein
MIWKLEGSLELLKRSSDTRTNRVLSISFSTVPYQRAKVLQYLTIPYVPLARNRPLRADQSPFSHNSLASLSHYSCPPHRQSHGVFPPFEVVVVVGLDDLLNDGILRAVRVLLESKALQLGCLTSPFVSLNWRINTFVMPFLTAHR